MIGCTSARLSALTLLAAACLSAAGNWKPIDPADLADRKPKVEAEADAEALFWEVQVSDEGMQGSRRSSFANYLRIKIYNNRGRDRQSIVHLRFNQRSHIDEIEGRTIHADGTVIDLSKDAIHEATTNTGGNTTREMTFSLPAVEPGSIIEYRWRVTNENGLGYLRLDFQRDIPIRVVRYQIKPFQGMPPSSAITQNTLTANSNQAMNDVLAARRVPIMLLQDFNARHSPLVKHGEYFETSMENVRAFKEEQPYMPPPDQFRAWSLAYYRAPNPPPPDQYWENLSRYYYNFYSQHMKAGKQVRSVAAEITSGAGSAAEKLARLSDFCRSKIKNTATDEVTAAERATAQKKVAQQTPDDTLKEGVGSPMNVRYLFAALAAASGFEVRIALMPDRRRMAFDRSFADTYFLTDPAVAVKVDGEWHFYDPAGTFIPHDLLAWHHEGVFALITDPKETVFVLTPVSTPEHSVTENKGTFKLSEDGTLEGDLVTTYTGHVGSVHKETSERQSAAQREESYKRAILARLSAAEISNIEIENATDIEKPFTYRCHLRIPGYAQVTGKRLFFAPAVMQQGGQPIFQLKERKYPILFPFARTENDVITIDLPEGYEFEDMHIPAPLTIAKSGEYSVDGRVEHGTHLVFHRHFVIGKDKYLGFSAGGYPALKHLFDEIALSDSQTLSLKQKGAGKVP